MGFSIKHSLRKADISKTNQYFINTFMPKIRFTFFFLYDADYNILTY